MGREDPPVSESMQDFLVSLVAYGIIATLLNLTATGSWPAYLIAAGAWAAGSWYGEWRAGEKRRRAAIERWEAKQKERWP